MDCEKQLQYVVVNGLEVSEKDRESSLVLSDASGEFEWECVVVLTLQTKCAKLFAISIKFLMRLHTLAHNILAGISQASFGSMSDTNEYIYLVWSIIICNSFLNLCAK